MSDGSSIPADLVARARDLGDGALELVVDAYQRARRAERSLAFQEAINACEREGLVRAERFVDLPDEDVAALEARFEAMASPVTAAYHEGLAEAVGACCARVRTLDERPPLH